MQRRLPPLNALRAFEAAGRLSSFSKAGEELNVTHSSISRHVRGLEARLGVQLFNKISKGVELTTTGREYLKDISPLLDQIETATELISPNQTDVIRITCEPTFALKWLMSAIGDFNKTRPDIDVRIDASHDIIDLPNSEFDLAIRFCSKPVLDLEAHIISQSPVYPVGAPQLLNPDIDLENPESLLCLDLLSQTHPELWVGWFQKTGLPVSRLKKSSGGLKTMLAIEAAAAGQGLALVSMELVHNDIKAGRLMKFSEIGLDYGAYNIVYTKKAGRQKSVIAFRDWLLEASKELRT